MNPYDFFTGLRKAEKPITTTVPEVVRVSASASKGDTDSQLQIAELASKGGVIAKTPKHAANLYEKVATKRESSSPEAAYKLSQLYKQGDIGVPQDSKEALKWLNMAHELGYNGSLARDFADLYNLNRSTVSSEAKPYFEQAAAEGDPEALFRLGKAYQKKDPVRSREYIYEAASKGQEEAQLWLAQSYASGTHGYRKNNSRAVDWFAIAANGGNPDAQYELGLRLIKGVGVARDKQKGFMYLIASANQGNGNAKKAILNMLRTTHLGSAKNRLLSILWQNDPTVKTPKTPNPGGRGGKVLRFLKDKLGDVWDRALNMIDW